MSTVKAALKAAKSAIDHSQWDEVITQADIVLASDPKNYYAKLFLGRAYERKDEIERAIQAYHEAKDIKPDDTQAWQGLVLLYENQVPKYIDQYGEASVRLAVLFGQIGDLHRSQTTIDKMIGLVKKHGTTDQHKRAMQVMLPGSPLWQYLEGRLPHPCQTFKRLVDITERYEQNAITKEIAERRTRIGARLGQVTEEVKREVYEKSDIQGLYRGVIDWTDEDDVRREYEERLFKREYDVLAVMPKDLKHVKRGHVMDMARGMVIVKHQCQLAWDLHLEWHDVAQISDLDINILLEYAEFFPTSGLTKVVRAYLKCEISPFTLPESSDEENYNLLEGSSTEDRLLLMAEGLGDRPPSPLAHRMTAEYYLHLEDYESAIGTARDGLRLLRAEEGKAAVTLQHIRDALNTTLATALIHHQSPKNHPEARELLEDVLKRKPDSAPALVGLGLVHEEQENYGDAVRYLSQAIELEPDNIRIRAEAAWCSALSGDLQEALDDLEECLNELKHSRNHDAKARSLLALTQYRIGVCVWEIDPSRAARKDRNGAYSHFVATIKTDPNFAQAYSSLGLYYADYAKDKKRARQCFQRAFELSASEVEAAERLARAFADKGEWDMVELVAQRVVDSGKTRPPPGSKKKGISWPYSALGVVQMMRQEYTTAITSFLAALRINPGDYHSFVGLGESYHNSGRYNSASRTFHYAEEPHDGVQIQISGERWFTEYMLANVHRELGDYDEAIERLRDVLKHRPQEFGVLIALLQTLVERAWKQVNTGLFGRAAASAGDALALAKIIAQQRPEAFNLWKAVGDACSIYDWTQSNASNFPAGEVVGMIQSGSENSVFEVLADLDGVGITSKTTKINGTTDGDTHVDEAQPNLPIHLEAALLAYKKAIHCCSANVHTQAVAWYNLGWAESRAYNYLPGQQGKDFLLAAVRCFKRAIELEAGNSEFWNALGVATSTLNARVAQHAFVRSLYLNERSAHVWTNLGVLYLKNNDHEVAHQAFSRAQSTDPEYAHAWIGEGLIALTVGQQQEALSHFIHAFEISDSSSLIAKRAYTVSLFDNLVPQKSLSSTLTALIQPLFALHQLGTQTPSSLSFRHLSALLSERVADYASAISTLTDLCTILESDYETTESTETLVHFAHANADLARNLLATSAFDSAIEHATTALSLTEDLTSPLPNSNISIPKIRLSANLTLGLAHSSTDDLDASVDAFRTALRDATDQDADTICLLARTLWKHDGGAGTERSLARDQLVRVLERDPSSIEARILLAAMVGIGAATEEVRRRTVQDLEDLLGEDGLSDRERTRVARVLQLLAGVRGDDNGGGGGDGMLDEVRCAVMRAPWDWRSWRALSEGVDADVEERWHAADMALVLAERSVPPDGSTEAADVAEVLAGTGKVGDAMRGLALAPWRAEGWTAFAEGLAGVAG